MKSTQNKTKFVGKQIVTGAGLVPALPAVIVGAGLVPAQISNVSKWFGTSFRKNPGLFRTGRNLILFLLIILYNAPLQAREKPTFLYIPGKENYFYRAVEKGIRQKTLELGGELIVSDYPQSWDPQKQLLILNKALAQKQPDIIILAPSSNDVLNAVLQKIHHQGAAIITVDRFLGTGDYGNTGSVSFPLTHIATDNKKGGHEIAELLAKEISSRGKIYISTTFPDIPAISDRFKSFMKALEEYPHISIVGIDIAGIDFSNTDQGGIGSSKEIISNARAQTLEMLQRFPDINAIYCTGYLVGLGTIQAIDETGLTGTIKVAVWEAAPPIITALKEGKVDLVLARNPLEIGMTAVYLGYQHRFLNKYVPAEHSVQFKFIHQDSLMTNQ